MNISVRLVSYDLKHDVTIPVSGIKLNLVSNLVTLNTSYGDLNFYDYTKDESDYQVLKDFIEVNKDVILLSDLAGIYKGLVYGLKDFNPLDIYNYALGDYKFYEENPKDNIDKHTLDKFMRLMQHYCFSDRICSYGEIHKEVVNALFDYVKVGQSEETIEKLKEIIVYYRNSIINE